MVDSDTISLQIKNLYQTIFAVPLAQGVTRLGQNHPLKLKKDWNLSFFSNSSPFTSRKIKLQLYAAYIFLNLLPSKPNPFLFLL